MVDFLMPALGADMETAKIVQWLVRPGERVKRGDIVAVVETHKGAIDVECFLEGIIDQLAPLGQPFPVGSVIAQVHGKDEAVTVPQLRTREQVSPAARRLAEQHGIELEGLVGSGGDGAVVLADVEREVEQNQATPSITAPAHPIAGRFDPAQMRLAIATAMGRSKREIPHYYLCSGIDFTCAQTWLTEWNATREPAERLLPAVLLLKATALALARVPGFNGFYTEGAFKPSSAVHVGWAVALRGGGLVAPALHEADQKSLPQLMTDMRDLVQRSRMGGLRSSELNDPTVTLSNFGDRGADWGFGVIYPPQVALIAFGRQAWQPRVVDGAIQARYMVNVSLAADHRVSDGHQGGLLLSSIDLALQSPATL